MTYYFLKWVILLVGYKDITKTHSALYRRILKVNKSPSAAPEKGEIVRHLNDVSHCNWSPCALWRCSQLGVMPFSHVRDRVLGKTCSLRPFTSLTGKPPTVRVRGSLSVLHFLTLLCEDERLHSSSEGGQTAQTAHSLSECDCSGTA